MKKYLFFFLVLFIISCSNNAKQQETTSTDQDETSQENISTTTPKTPKKEAVILISTVNNLRIRDQPNKTGKVLAEVGYGQAMIYLHKESAKKEKITLRGKERNATWKKVSFEAPQDIIEGWVYGGATINQTNLFQANTNGGYTRKVDRMSKEELSELLGISIPYEYFYDGIIRYKKEGDNKWLKQGKFEVKGNKEVEISDNYTHTISVEYYGTFSDNIPNGVFEQKWTGYEGGSITTLNFENGKCIWGTHLVGGEGEEYSHREENPTECSFDYIQQKMEEKQGWN